MLRRTHAAGLSLTLFLTLGLLSSALINTASAQAPKKIPSPEDISLEAAGGVVLRATWYPSTEGKNAAPVIIIHGFGGSRSEYHEAALALQQAGHAILVPDLRGHGDSKSYKVGDEKIEADKMRPNEYDGFLRDIEACKRFLIDKNNEAECNIDKLCVVGSQMGAIIAINWSAADWSFPILATGKQGQDVKAIVLLSPERSFKTLNCNRTLEHPAVAKQLSFYLLAGKRDKTDAKRIYDSIDRYRRKTAEEDKHDLVLSELDTTLQGTKLLQLKELTIPERMVRFFKQRAVDQPYEWKERRNPLTGQ